MSRARLDLKWEIYGSTAMGSAPPIPHYRCKVGKGKDGTTWLCDIRPIGEKLDKILLSFDTDQETEDGSPFLRDSVVNAKDYWKAHHDYHKSRYVKYHEIEENIRKFIVENHLQAKDVTGKAVK
jgi:hypothetical protein